jgi:hypothetical protein
MLASVDVVSLSTSSLHPTGSHLPALQPFLCTIPLEPLRRQGGPGGGGRVYHAFICLWASYGQLKVGAIMAYEDVDMHNLTLLVGTSLSHPRAKEATHTAQATPTDGYSLQAAAVGTL